MIQYKQKTHANLYFNQGKSLSEFKIITKCHINTYSARTDGNKMIDWIIKTSFFIHKI